MHSCTSILLFNLLTALAQALALFDGSSFGSNGVISPNGKEIPGWQIVGEGQLPQLLSDKAVLTPPHPGNVRGALWANSKIGEGDWIAELEFRASGPDRGSGNLQIWYTKDGQSTVGTSSLYTIGKFDGLVIVVDQYGGKGGSIRGFMNDGSIDFKGHYALDSLAFGHCDFSFRNLGRPAKLQIRQESQNFEVIIDGRLCFGSDKIRMPSEYSFGITAGSAETPDSFEVYKFQTWTPPAPASNSQKRPQAPPNNQAQMNNRDAQSQPSDAQFKEINNKLLQLSQALEKLERQLSNIASNAETRHRELTRNFGTQDILTNVKSHNEKIDRVDRTLNGFQEQFTSLRSVVRDSHESLSESLPRHVGSIITTNAPRMGLLICVFVAMQIILYGAYTIYKRRSKQGTKKYL